MKYIKFHSVTWWAGIALLIKATATTIIEKSIDVQGFAEGLGLIGIRGAIR